MTKFHQGYFKPKNPQKYKGDIKNICYRSSLEFRFMSLLDKNPEVIQWASEEFNIPYWDPVTKRNRRYFPDFIIKTKEQTIIIEVKPLSECSQPTIIEGKSKNRYRKELTTWVTNQAKWEAATNFSKERGFHFKIVTDKDLGIRY